MSNWKNKILTFLRWSATYTKTDMLYLVRSGSWLGLGQIVATGSAFLTSIAFANLLPPETYGAYKYVLSITSIILITTLSGMDSAVTRSVAKGLDGTFIQGAKTKTKWGLLGTIASMFVAVYYYTQGNAELALAFCIVGIFAPFAESLDIYNALLLGKKLFDTQTKYSVIRKLLSLVVLVGTLFLTDSLLIIIIVYFVVLAASGSFFFWKTIKGSVANKENDVEAIPYGKHLSFISIIGLLAAEFDKILIFHYLGSVNLAIYALAIAPNDQIKGVLKNINTLALPQFSNRTPTEIGKTIWRKVGILTLVTSLIVLIYILLAPWFFSMFFPKYLASVIYSQVLSVSLIPVVAAGFLYTVLQSQKDTGAIYKYNIYSNVFNIIILVPLIYYFGIWGAVISRVATRLVTFGISTFLVRKIS